MKGACGAGWCLRVNGQRAGKDCGALGEHIQDEAAGGGFGAGRGLGGALGDGRTRDGGGLRFLDALVAAGKGAGLQILHCSFARGVAPAFLGGADRQGGFDRHWYNSSDAATHGA